ncbi:Villin headpiece [Dillenia turbinata]|uniref:Villin headpiece n=1 Tax=Dillenia turbinata TaxID=194707 RepID=A0AAN8VBH9_9MAGN
MGDAVLLLNVAVKNDYVSVNENLHSEEGNGYKKIRFIGKMSLKGIDSAFHVAGTKPGLEIWCIENLQLVPVPHPSHGKFYSGSSYLILNTIMLRTGILQHDIHYWLGNAVTEVDATMASDKALELGMALGPYTVQYREVQGLETQKFLSYFKPCIIPIEGVFSSRAGERNSDAYQISLLTCKGDHIVHVKEVPFSRSSLNHNDVFILDTASKIFLFSGCNSSIQERAKALDVVQYIKDNKHSGKCAVATIEDGKFVSDPDVGEFWNLFGGYAPMPKDLPYAVQTEPETSSGKITIKGQLCETGTDTLNKEMLDTDKCYMLDTDSEIFVWMGKNTSISERKTSISAAEEFLRSQGRSTGTKLISITEGLETAAFRSFFSSWPQKVQPRLYDEGRGKVAAIFKHQGYDVKELPEEDFQPLIDCSGILKVWRVNGDELYPLPMARETMFYSGDCYIVQYIYPEDGREENLFYAWLGRDSVMEDRVDVISHMNTIGDSTKRDPVLAQVFQGKEPSQFLSILKILVIYKGGLSPRYKRFLEEKGVIDETYDKEKIALFQIQGTCPDSMQAIQVDSVSSSLNSCYCYILQTGTSAFTWMGNLSSSRDHDLLDRIVDLLNPWWQPTSIREGSETDDFWNALGGKAEYRRDKEIKKYIEDPHLFMCSFSRGDLKVKEIFNFTQDDLTTEDILLLDCHEEVYVWRGRHSSDELKKQVFTFGLKFLEMDVLDEGLSLETPIYIVTEGHEPPFFTCFFSWDSSKSKLHGNSFERKLAILKGKSRKVEAPIMKSRKAPIGNSLGSTRGNSIFANGLDRSGSPRSGFTNPHLKQFDNRRFSSPIVKSSVLSASLSSPSQIVGVQWANPSEIDASLLVLPYERLKVVSNVPATGIDVTKREAYLSEEEFKEKFKMTKSAFYALPKWRQNKHKLSLHLF